MTVAFAVMPVHAQAPADKPPHEQLIEGLRSLFRAIFGGGDDKPAAVEEKPSDEKSPEKPAPAPPAEPQPVQPTRAAQVQPQTLHAMVAKGDEEGARRMIEGGADIETKDPGAGASALHYAVMRGNRAIVAMLLARGADVNSRTKSGTTPLHTAVLYNHYEVAEQLLERGADANAASASGATPLALATAAKRRDIAELLRSRGAK
jgi:hypothetical protein